MKFVRRGRGPQAIEEKLPEIDNNPTARIPTITIAAMTLRLMVDLLDEDGHGDKNMNVAIVTN